MDITSTTRDLVDLLENLVFLGGVPFGIIAVALLVIHRGERKDATEGVDRVSGHGRLGGWAAPVVSLVAGIAVWMMWLSRQSTGTDADGYPVDPYQTWQVVACGVTAVAVVALLGWFTTWRVSGPMSTVWGFLLGFSTSWAVWADIASDPTGQSGIGYVKLIVGGGAGLGLVAAGVVLLRGRHHRLTP